MSNYLVNNTSTNLNNFYVTTNSQIGPTTNYKQNDGTDIGSNFKLYVYGTRKACNYMSGTTDIGTYYQYDSTSGTTTYDTGAYNTYPWYISTSQMANARWIWNTANARDSASSYVYIWFYYTFYYSGSANTGTLYSSCDDVGTFSLNGGTGININGGWPTARSSSISIVNGLNYIRVCAYNMGGPAGLLIAIYDSNGTNIVNTSTAWVNSVSTNSTYNQGGQPFNNSFSSTTGTTTITTTSSSSSGGTSGGSSGGSSGGTSGGSSGGTSGGGPQ
jgi:hypothetical protein